MNKQLESSITPSPSNSAVENRDPLHDSLSKTRKNGKLDDPSYRSWNRRLQREEVFNKYYFPAKWEILELNFLIQFFDLKDPTSIASSKNGEGSKQNSINAGSNLLGKSIQLGGTNGGNSQDNVGGAANPNGRRKAGRRRSKSWMGNSTTPGTSKIGMNSKQNPSLFASFSTSIIKSFQGGAQSDMLNFVTDQSKKKFDPVEATKQTLNFIFFPFVHDPKSVLLMRGSVLTREVATKKIVEESEKRSLDDEVKDLGEILMMTKRRKASTLPETINTENEKELLLFTHGFAIANILVDDVIQFFLALGDKGFSTVKGFLDHLKSRFLEIGVDEKAGIDEQELFELFHELKIPKCGSLLKEVIHISDNLTLTPAFKSEKIDCKAFLQALKLFSSRSSSPDPGHTSSNNASNGNAFERGDSYGSDGSSVKRWFGMFQKDDDDVLPKSKLENAFLYSSVLHVEYPELFQRGETVNENDSDPSRHSEFSFAVTVVDKKHDPLVFTCCKQEYRDAWVCEAFSTCVLRALENSTDPDTVELRSKLGWQHMVIRSTYSSLVVLNDADSLERVLQRDQTKGSEKHKLSEILNKLDSYNGLAALHYATILGHVKCMEVLLKAGAIVSSADKEGLSAMYHGKMTTFVITFNFFLVGLTLLSHLIKALCQRNDETANLLEKYGADRCEDLKRVIEKEIREQENTNRDPLENAVSESKYSGTRALTEDTDRALNGSAGSVAMDEEEDIDELLLQAVRHLGG